MDINYAVVVGGAVASMIVGAIWYGPLFGKKWMEIIGATDADLEKRKEMQKKALPLYLIQFALTLVQVYVLSGLISWHPGSAVGIAFWMWLGFIMPTIAGSSMWNNNPTNVKWAQFLIQSGYQLVMLLIYGAMFAW